MHGWAARLRIAVEPFADFVKRRYWFAILAFIALFKLGEALAGIMTAPFYRELGFSRLEVASVSSVFGLFATLLGVADRRLAGGEDRHRAGADPDRHDGDAVQPDVCGARLRRA